MAWRPAAAFKAAKGALTAAVLLVHPASNAVLSLATDAFDTHVGGVVQQLAGGAGRHSLSSQRSCRGGHLVLHI
jgi:hypothetical protein